LAHDKCGPLSLGRHHRAYRPGNLRCYAVKRATWTAMA
jgi:hypothetical protein